MCVVWWCVVYDVVCVRCLAGAAHTDQVVAHQWGAMSSDFLKTLVTGPAPIFRTISVRKLTPPLVPPFSLSLYCICVALCVRILSWFCQCDEQCMFSVVYDIHVTKSCVAVMLLVVRLSRHWTCSMLFAAYFYHLPLGNGTQFTPGREGLCDRVHKRYFS